jgi:23S rRNA maturation-related 3'-5' exoribonuclease YhaM
VRRKKFFDQEKMKKIMQGELQDMLTNYTMNRNMEWVRQDTMEQISDEYMKTMSNIDASKRDILNKIDGLHILTIKSD